MKSIIHLTELISKFPGIGPKSARRIVSFLLKSDNEYVSELSDNISKIKTAVHPCKICGMWSENEICDICSDTKRDNTKICVVENNDDVLVIEGSGVYNGLYHILGGRISPLNGVFPENLNFDQLKKRVLQEQIDEIIIATNPNEEGDVTAMYIKNMINKAICVDGDSNRNIKFTRPAIGLQSGGNIEYATSMALISSLTNRQDL